MPRALTLIDPSVSHQFMMAFDIAGVRVVGSRDGDGVIALVIEGHDLPEPREGDVMATVKRWIESSPQGIIGRWERV